MTAQAFQARERRRNFIFQAQVAVFSLMAAAAFFMFVATCFQLETLAGGF